jgi:hypothetical protein
MRQLLRHPQGRLRFLHRLRGGGELRLGNPANGGKPFGDNHEAKVGPHKVDVAGVSVSRPCAWRQGVVSGFKACKPVGFAGSFHVERGGSAFWGQPNGRQYGFAKAPAGVENCCPSGVAGHRLTMAEPQGHEVAGRHHQCLPGEPCRHAGPHAFAAVT